MTRGLVEIFGHAPDDFTPAARKFWTLGVCPFVGRSCTKFDHTNTICYGTCSVTNTGHEVIICPIRLYENNYASIRQVATDAFGAIPMYLFDQYLQAGSPLTDCVVALGQNSGREVKLKAMSMDWVLAHISGGKLIEYIGIEVQSIDITGNYRDAWYAIRDKQTDVPQSRHGLNWANVHKRLIPQIIRKGLVYSRSTLVKKGLYFIVPDAVYQKFEDVIGKSIPQVTTPGPDTISVYTYEIGSTVSHGLMRSLNLKRTMRFKLGEFSNRFISGPNLPGGLDLDKKIKDLLAVL